MQSSAVVMCKHKYVCNYSPCSLAFDSSIYLRAASSFSANSTACFGETPLFMKLSASSCSGGIFGKEDDTETHKEQVRTVS
jgi:hypothetical protein